MNTNEGLKALFEGWDWETINVIWNWTDVKQNELKFKKKNDKSAMPVWINLSRTLQSLRIVVSVASKSWVVALPKPHFEWFRPRLHPRERET